MIFRTKIEATPYPFQIQYRDSLLFIGSCFSDNIGQKLSESGFNTLINPFGVLYNPVSIANGIEILLEDRRFTSKDLFEYKGLFHSFYHHGKFSLNTENETLKVINESITQHREQLLKTDILFITFGTAFVYEHIERDIIVSNCHKLPAKNFRHYMLDVNEIVSRYKVLLNKLLSLNPKLKIVATVSPVRHWKNGAHRDQLSKSTLLLSIHRLQQDFEALFYYPSYEILMDDLRDYRFYKEDMLHPNSIAVNYIYEHFRTCFYTAETQKLEQEVIKLKKALNHRPINPNTQAHQDFVKATRLKMESLIEKHPYVRIKG